MNESPKDPKLIPEWDVDEDDQVLLAGLAVLGVVLLVLGWNWWRGDDGAGDDLPLTAAVESVETDLDGDGETDLVVVTPDADADADVDADVDVDADTAAPTTTAEVETTTTEVTPLDLAPDVAAAVSSFGIDSSVDGDVATLQGFVGSDDESAAAEAAAGDVPGVVTVVNELEVLLPSVTEAMTNAGVVQAAPMVEGQTATAIGIIATEDDRAATIAAVEAVPGVEAPAIDRLKALAPDVDAALAGAGVESPSSDVSITPGDAGAVVTVRGGIAEEAARAGVLDAVSGIEGVDSVVDELTVAGGIASDLNEILELEPIQFATGSSEILEASFPTLDRIVELMGSDTTTRLEIQGYTDTRGPEDSNLRLSQGRADAVLAYLTSKGIPAEQLSATGYGETTEFGDTDAENRRVRFEVVADS